MHVLDLPNTVCVKRIDAMTLRSTVGPCPKKIHFSWDFLPLKKSVATGIMLYRRTGHPFPPLRFDIGQLRRGEHARFEVGIRPKEFLCRRVYGLERTGI